ncbi:non-homologous end-joining DNA ligase [Angustibacter aerolatus]
MLATAAPPGAPPPGGDDWLHEVKWDGMRLLVEVRDGRLRAFSRTEADVTVSFPELAGLTAAGADLLLDGEVVAFDEGRPSFAALAERMHVQDPRRARALAEVRPVQLVVFDVLRLYGVELLGRTFDDRRATLERLELPEGPWQVPGVFADGPGLLEATRAQGLEGIVSKRRGSLYHPGRRSRDWVKKPHRSTQSCLVGGWRPQTGTRSRLGALLLGVPDDEGLRFVGRAGSGIGGRLAAVLGEALGPLQRSDSPFVDAVPRADAVGSVWVEPRVVVEISHLGHGGQGRLRQPVVLGLRPDVPTEEVRDEP